MRVLPQKKIRGFGTNRETKSGMNPPQMAMPNPKAMSAPQPENYRKREPAKRMQGPGLRDQGQYGNLLGS